MIQGRRLGSLRVAVPLVALLGVVVTGCTGNGSVVKTEGIRQTYTTGDAPYVVIETFNGRITVEATADETVDARVTRRGSGTTEAAAERDLQNVEVDFTELGNRITITARRDDEATPLGNSGADVDVLVPEGSSVELRTSNGRVESANVKGVVIVRTSNGAITTRGGSALDLDTTNGPVSVNSPAGVVRARTSNGSIDIVAAKEASVTAQTSNDSVTFSGTLLPGEHSLNTSNGRISITLPGDTIFRMDGQTSNGSTRTEFTKLRVTDTTITGTTGPLPGITVTARTSNGDLVVLTQKP